MGQEYLLYPINRWAKLTRREWALAKRFAQVGTYPQIAKELGWSSGYTELVAHEIYKKLKLNRIQLAICFAVTKDLPSPAQIRVKLLRMASKEQKLQARMIMLLASKMDPSGQELVLNMLVGALSSDLKVQNALLKTVRAQAEGELHRPTSKAFEAVE